MRPICVLLKMALGRAAGLAGLLAFVVVLAGAVASRADAGPIEPPDLPKTPEFLLPWEDGVEWVTGTAGFHGGNDALDFFPPDSPPSSELICKGDPNWYKAVSEYWVLAAAAGTVVQAERPYVVIDHGDGWTSGYLHLTGIAVEAGQEVQAGDALGHPSTYGFCVTGPHVHFWVAGPNGETTRNVSLSGRPAEEIGLNERIGETGNDPGAVPTPGPSPTPTPEPGTLAGDVDCDGDVDSVDGLFVLLEVGGIDAGKCVATAADVDCSGATDAVDALKVMRHVAGLPVVLPEGCARIGTTGE